VRTQRPITPLSNDDEEIAPIQNTDRTQNLRLQYILHGLSGELEIDVMRTKNIRYDDLVSNLARDQQSKDIDEQRKSMQYETHRIRNVDVWLPPGVSANMINYISQLKAKAEKVDRIKRLFSRKTCVLSKRSMRMIAGFSLHNSGGSDQAFSLALAVAWKVLFLEIDLDVTNEQLANGTPCQTTFSKRRI